MNLNQTNNNQNAASAKIGKPLWWHSLKLSGANVGAIVEGKVICKTPRAVYLDLGDMGSGIVWGAEFGVSGDIVDKIQEGENIRAKIIISENEKGFVELSLREAYREMGWRAAKEASGQNETLSGKITGANRGGLLIQTENLQGFLPTSQMAESRFPKSEINDKEKIAELLSKMIGQEIKVKVLEFNPKDGKVIFSEKRIEEDAIRQLISKYEINNVVKGTIIKINSYGALVSLNEDERVRGFVPVSEISWDLTEDPTAVLKNGQEIETKVIGTKDAELRLSLREMSGEVWEEKVHNYKEAQEVSGEIKKITPFGVFIKLEDGVYGFAHSSEYGGSEKMKEKAVIGQKHDFIIDSIKEKERKINLKLR